MYTISFLFFFNIKSKIIIWIIIGGQLDEIVFFLVAFDIAINLIFLLFIFVQTDCLCCVGNKYYYYYCYSFVIPENCIKRVTHKRGTQLHNQGNNLSIPIRMPHLTAGLKTHLTAGVAYRDSQIKSVWFHTSAYSKLLAIFL